MAKIVYGVSGEGSGHSSRARVIATHLVERGHQVRIISYDRGLRNLKDDFDLFETEGLHIAQSENQVSRLRTLTENLKKLPQGHARLKALREEVFKTMQPECVFTDFEPMTAYLATYYDLPLITIDNQHRLRYMVYPCPEQLSHDNTLTRNIIRAMIPRPDVSLVTTFFYGELKNSRTFLYPPILRREVLGLTPLKGDHVLVYLTGEFQRFIDILPHFKNERFVIYGYDREETVDNCQYKPFSKAGFLLDLAGSKAVMATAGFTLITEALFLKKPYLAMPIKGQFEQEINAHFLEHMGYGLNVYSPSVDVIQGFLDRLPEFNSRLDGYRAEDNSKILDRVDELLANDCALAKAFHDLRKRG
ncbi:MAG: hypothetical protein D3926_21090 [Desulfobacteraceae bacterium]|nr:MAG: hypothetical protein D3926_21090 [Desulfobacteraceae bacterium]